MQKKLNILGTRGIPANHGGFETFAEHLAIYLVKNEWDVTVYCQIEGCGEALIDDWNGIRRVNIPVDKTGALGTVIFDYKSTLHAAKSDGLILTLGYNTAIFSTIYRLKKRKNIINMDGIEWKRAKWSFFERAWLYFNERIGCHIGNLLIADHPEIENHLSSRVSNDKIVMIPYGADQVSNADKNVLLNFGLTPNNYALVIARPEPENSIFEIVTAFSQKKRNIKLVVLGDYNKGNIAYCKKVKDAASDEVIFPGAIYDKLIVQALRYFTLLYIHGHQVGGTNPSLVEALGAENAILAHDNCYNRWVAGEINHYFDDIDSCQAKLDWLLNTKDVLDNMKYSSMSIYKSKFTWPRILNQYKTTLLDFL
ncbi:MAG: DUF1972 domain-containing protein [Candidatus Thiodiazotropha sp.]